jgi:hypothetical protein
MASNTLTRIEFLKMSAGFIGIGALPLSFGCPGETEDEGGDDVATDPTDTPGSTSTGPGEGTTMEPPGTTTGEPGTTTTGVDSSSSGMPPGTDTGSTSEGESTSASGCTMDPDVVIGTNHNHEMVVPLADVMAGVQVVYDIQGTSMHPHTVTLTADHFTMLQQGMQVVVESSFDGHSHTVTVSCG